MYIGRFEGTASHKSKLNEPTRSILFNSGSIFGDSTLNTYIEQRSREAQSRSFFEWKPGSLRNIFFLVRKTVVGIGNMFGCFARKIDDPGLPGGLIIYQGHLFPKRTPVVVRRSFLSFQFQGHGRMPLYWTHLPKQMLCPGSIAHMRRRKTEVRSGEIADH